jgi:hypothetical protein
MKLLPARPPLFAQALAAGLIDLQFELAHLDWHEPLTRDDIGMQWPAFPQYIYLRLPAAKCFTSAGEVVRTLYNAEMRALSPEAADDLADERIVRMHGGPPSMRTNPSARSSKLR